MRVLGYRGPKVFEGRLWDYSSQVDRHEGLALCCNGNKIDLGC